MVTVSLTAHSHPVSKCYWPQLQHTSQISPSTTLYRWSRCGLQTLLSSLPPLRVPQPTPNPTAEALS